MNSISFFQNSKQPVRAKLLRQPSSAPIYVEKIKKDIRSKEEEEFRKKSLLSSIRINL